ncbi:MAG: TfoX/Sxy family protein [Bacteroidetes bacterium]|nr:TfoX/Sxy family protein [Bacteroidota bacterium]
MKELTDLPNIGKVLAEKLATVGIINEPNLADAGSENAIIRLSTLDNSGVCINMLYALEGAIQGIRWHDLSKEKKDNLRDFYNSTIRK